MGTYLIGHFELRYYVVHVDGHSRRHDFGRLSSCVQTFHDLTSRFPSYVLKAPTSMDPVSFLHKRSPQIFLSELFVQVVHFHQALTFLLGVHDHIHRFVNLFGAFSIPFLKQVDRFIKTLVQLGILELNWVALEKFEEIMKTPLNLPSIECWVLVF